MAVIQSDEGDYYGSQESLLTSLKYLNEQKEKDHYCLLADYNELGSTSLNLRSYEAAISYYDQALKFIKDDNFKIITLNNKAVVYQKMQHYDQAIAIGRSIIEQSKKDKKEYARILSNLSRTRWLQDSNYRAAPDLLAALQIRKDEKDDWGLNASYSHLSDYYSHSHPDSALTYADSMYAVAKKLNSPDDELEALQKLITLSPARDVQQYFKSYQQLADSIQTSRIASKDQFALIRYDAEKNKADNLRLQKDNTDKKLQIIKQRLLIYGTLSLFIIGVAIVAGWVRKRKKQTRNAIREQQLRTSQKVHDVVANGLYHIMMGIEHQDTIEKEDLLDQIEILYERSRDISYEQPEAARPDFQKGITGLLMSFATPATKVLVIGNQEKVWSSLKDPVKIELEHVLQELMINMKKHSAARHVVIRFQQEHGQLKIQYTDDGIGLPPAFRYGNGLTNTENRITNIGGQIIFEKQRTNGLKIEIYLPIA
ncbi:MAG TPA: ATP-binding protein [Puia sp.]|nr:ATP-binding protein [Puia sp.]